MHTCKFLFCLVLILKCTNVLTAQNVETTRTQNKMVEGNNADVSTSISAEPLSTTQAVNGGATTSNGSALPIPQEVSSILQTSTSADVDVDNAARASINASEQTAVLSGSVSLDGHSNDNGIAATSSKKSNLLETINLVGTNIVPISKQIHSRVSSAIVDTDHNHHPDKTRPTNALATANSNVIHSRANMQMNAAALILTFILWSFYFFLLLLGVALIWYCFRQPIERIVLRLCPRNRRSTNTNTIAMAPMLENSTFFQKVWHYLDNGTRRVRDWVSSSRDIRYHNVPGEEDLHDELLETSIDISSVTNNNNKTRSQRDSDASANLEMGVLKKIGLDKRKSPGFDVDEDGDKKLMDNKISTIFVPTLHEATKKCILNKSLAIALSPHLPSRFQLRDWKLLYSTLVHGDLFLCHVIGPSILLIRDTNGHVFGSFVSESWRRSKQYFGTGETFVFRLLPSIEVFHWQPRNNSYFVLANDGNVAIGGGDNFSIFVDDRFHHGISSSCATFNSVQLSATKEFECHSLEVWGFV